MPEIGERKNENKRKLIPFIMGQRREVIRNINRSMCTKATSAFKNPDVAKNKRQRIPTEQ